MATTPDDGSHASPDHIDQIRDIILGPQKRQFDQRFEKLSADFQRYQDEARARIDALEASAREELNTLRHATEKDLKQLAATYQKTDADHRKVMEAQHAEMARDLAAGIERTREVHASLQQELNDARAKFQSELRAMREQLSREIDTQVVALRENNVSREFMAELLQELAVKLRGVEVIEELKKAPRRKSAD
jgi:ElaB/YqjD/DUF883 family membrane-anchored ribosome-binding protein